MEEINIPPSTSSISPSSIPRNKKPLYIGLGTLVILIAGSSVWAFMSYQQKSSTNDNGLATPTTSPISNSSPDSEFKQIYLNWTHAIQAGSIENTYPYLTLQAKEKIQQQYAQFNESQKQQVIDFLKTSAPKNDTDVSFGAAIAEDQRGILRVELIAMQDNPISLVKDPRSYGTIFFMREDNNWKIDKQSFLGYKDPTPIHGDLTATPNWHAQFHANHTTSSALCSSQGVSTAPCYHSWAILNRDVNICNQISPTNTGSERDNCYDDVAFLTGNPDFCIDRPSVDFCRSAMADSTYLSKTNIYTIDSDHDGLTDFQESYFNTSMVKADTDGDGVNDGLEVKNDTNPLGTGKLGDNLIK